jgi:hypothetical protein
MTLNEQTIREMNHLFGLSTTTPTGKIRYRWQSPLQIQEMGDFCVVPLTSTKDLASEGWNMRHCVASYDVDCANGLYQVFSIRDLDGKRLATLGLRYDPNGWKLDQCLGLLNAEVTTSVVEWIDGNGNHHSINQPTEIHFLAQEVERLMKYADWNTNDL